MDGLCIFESNLEVFDELGVGEVEFLKLVIFHLQCIVLSHRQGVLDFVILNVIVDVCHILRHAVEVSLQSLVFVSRTDEGNHGRDEHDCQE